MALKIIGIRPSSFKGDDGSKVEGVNIYVTYPIEAGKGSGYASERVYVTNAKMFGWSYQPKVGDEVNIVYNRYGKCDSMSLAK